MIYIFHKVTTSKSARSRAVKITKFLLLAVKQNSRKSAFLRITIDRSMSKVIRYARIQSPDLKIRLSLGVAAWWVYAVESGIASSWKTKLR